MLKTWKTASLGNLSYDLLRGLYYACQGMSPRVVLLIGVTNTR